MPSDAAAAERGSWAVTAFAAAALVEVAWLGLLAWMAWAA